MTSKPYSISASIRSFASSILASIAIINLGPHNILKLMNKPRNYNLILIKFCLNFK